jgi:hypothetical protein
VAAFKSCLPLQDNAIIHSHAVELKVNLAKSRTVALTDAFQEPLAAQVAQTLAQHTASPRTVAETAAITSLRATDLIEVVKSVSAVRNTKSGKSVAFVELIDGSLTQSGLTATVSVSVFGSEKIDLITRGQRRPLVFFNLVAKY